MDVQQQQIEVIRYAEPVSYRDAFRAQVERRDAVIDGRLPEAVFLLQHTPVITLGREANDKNLLCAPDELRKLGIDVEQADRGGDVTYHGPGQLVAYPVLDLKRRALGIRQYLRVLEDTVIDTLAEYGLKGERIYGLTGVWVAGAKVAAIGVGARRWVTYHGAAINIDPDMTNFARIIPCGIVDKPVTSLRQLLGEAPACDDVSARLERHLLDRFPPA
jgi:lipoate-protein ligase B